MLGRTTIRVSGSLRGLLPLSFVLLAGIASTAGNQALAQDAAASCAPVVGRVVSLQGNVEVQRVGTPNWLKVSRLDTSICAGDRLRTDALSRAALFVQPETLVRVDQNTTISLSLTTAEVLVEFHTDEVSQTAQNAQSCGAGYFITRFPRKFKVSTPHMNAAVEGTEFMVESSCKSSTLTVLEGKVLSQSAATQESRSLTAGQRLETGPASGSVFSTVIKPVDAVQWVLRYPPLSDAATEAEISTAEQCRALPKSTRPSCLTERAEVLLRLGSVDHALQDIDQALAVNATDSDANALRAIIQIAKNENFAALESAEKATAAEPNNYRALIAQSYAEQASFELERALASASKALALRPAGSLVQARVAELQLSLGHIRDAELSARAAVAANASESDAHSILGFVHLSQVDIDAARADFESAIQHDSFNAMPRLGLGLAMIRLGELVKGREQLEIAVALAPGNSLLRSYAGKAYYEENTRERDSLAATQFLLAQQLDPMDPTPWYYQAFLQQSWNKPVAALDSLQASIEKNDNRAVYRSRLLVDDDAAARKASVAAIYDDLGFEKLAIVESIKALAQNSGNYSAHQQLASAYADLPRHEIARVSEALQAQIRQPVSLASMGPQLNTDNLTISRDTGPARAGANEFNVLFNQNDLRFQFDGIAGNLDTYGNQFAASALVDKVSYTLSQLHYESDGFADNSAAEKDVYDFIVHGQISPGSTVQADIKRSEFSVGQTFFPFDEFPTPTTIIERSDTLRLSGHQLVDTGGDWIWSAVTEDRDRAVRSFPDGGLFTRSNAQPYAVEVQYSGRVGGFQFVSGLGYVDEDEHFDPDPTEIRSRAANAYLYGAWKVRESPLSVHVGLAAEWFKARSTSPFTSDTDPVDRSRLSPKLGIVWSPRAGTSVRAAALSSVRRPFVRSQTIEPTQVAGFNQFFTGFEDLYGDFLGSVSDRVGIAVDQAFSPGTLGGVEVTTRRMDVPSSVFDRDFTWREKTAHVYLYKTHHWNGHQGRNGGWQAAFSAEIEYEEIDRPQILTGSEGIMELKTQMAPLGVQFFNDKGLTLRTAMTYVRQDGQFSVDEGFPVVEQEDEAWITDLSLEWRLPRRQGIIAIGVRNAFDETVELLEIDPFSPRVATKRFLFGKFSLEF